MTKQWVFETNEQDFEKQVLERSKTAPVLVDFWAIWCGPCRMLGPVLEEAVEERQGEVLLAKINSDENPNLAARYGIQSIPTVLAFIDGELANGFMGALPLPAIRQFIEEVLPKETDQLARKAEALALKQRWDEALQSYREALRSDPNHSASLIGQLGVLIRLERWPEAGEAYQKLPGLLQIRDEVQILKTRLDLGRAQAAGLSIPELQKKLEADPDDLEARDQLASLLAAKQQYRDALEEWLTIVKRDRRFKDDGARKRMLQIFELIDPRSPLAEEYRDKLARVIFR
ncbi:MAG TPA: thioredoxin [Nitrospiria bacterium]|nr:thioredoxin [Nitrospiria bacterium]